MSRSPAGESIEELLDVFLVEVEKGRTPKNRWLYADDFSAYVRKGLHRVGEGFHWTLDIAAIEAANPGSGVGSRFLAYALEVCPYSAVYVESVLNPRFAEKLRREGWTEIRDEFLAGPLAVPNFYKWTNPSSVPVDLEAL